MKFQNWTLSKHICKQSYVKSTTNRQQRKQGKTTVSDQGYARGFLSVILHAIWNLAHYVCSVYVVLFKTIIYHEIILQFRLQCNSFSLLNILRNLWRIIRVSRCRPSTFKMCTLWSLPVVKAHRPRVGHKNGILFLKYPKIL